MGIFFFAFGFEQALVLRFGQTCAGMPVLNVKCEIAAVRGWPWTFGAFLIACSFWSKMINAGFENYFWHFPRCLLMDLICASTSMRSFQLLGLGIHLSILVESCYQIILWTMGWCKEAENSFGGDKITNNKWINEWMNIQLWWYCGFGYFWGTIFSYISINEFLQSSLI